MAPFDAMSLTTAATDYITKIIRVPGMKALMLDKETMHMVGLCFSLSSLIQHQVFLTEQIDRDTPSAALSSPPSSTSIEMQEHNKEDRMPHLKCLCLIRPSRSSLAALRVLLASQRFAHYHLYFTAIMTDMDLRDVAASDVHGLRGERARVLPRLLRHAPAPLPPRRRPHSTHCTHQPAYWLGKEKAAMKRQVDGLCAVLLSLKKQAEIRYVDKSEICRLMANEVYRHQQEDRELFAFSAHVPDPPPSAAAARPSQRPDQPAAACSGRTPPWCTSCSPSPTTASASHTLHKDLRSCTRTCTR